MSNLLGGISAVCSLAGMYFFAGLLMPRLPLVRSRGRAAKFLGLSFVGIMVFGSVGQALETPEQREQRRIERERDAASQQEAKAAKTAHADQARVACSTDLHCIGEKHLVEATVACSRYVERLAKNDFQWTNKWYEPTFSRYRWADHPGGSIVYVGDKIKFQNGFGAWTNAIYSCTVDSATGQTVQDVEATAGRLP
jgi:hypothetical protein